jgi:excisionase family DNA binding protein
MFPLPNCGSAAELLTVEEAAKRLRLSTSTLNKWRVTGEGPAFVKLGRRVLYRASDLSDWLAGSTFGSTSGYSKEECA